MNICNRVFLGKLRNHSDSVRDVRVRSIVTVAKGVASESAVLRGRALAIASNSSTSTSAGIGIVVELARHRWSGVGANSKIKTHLFCYMAVLQ